jgi:signal peptidase II
MCDRLPMTRIGVRLALLFAMIVTVGCDRVTKQVAASTLADAPARSLLGDTIRLEYVENAGAFLGLGADWSPPIRTAVFVVGNGLLLALPLFGAFRGGWSQAARLGAALVAAGGLSNLSIESRTERSSTS